MTFDNSFEIENIHSDACSNVTLTLERLRLHIIATVVGHTLNVLALVASANYKQKTKCNYCKYNEEGLRTHLQDSMIAKDYLSCIRI